MAEEVNIHQEYEDRTRANAEKRLKKLNKKYHVPLDFGLRLSELVNERGFSLPKYSLILVFGYDLPEGAPGSKLEYKIEIGTPDYAGKSNWQKIQNDWSNVADKIEELVKKIATSVGRDIELVKYGGDVNNRPLWSYSTRAFIRSHIKEKINEAAAEGREFDHKQWLLSDEIDNIYGGRIIKNTPDVYSDPDIADENGYARIETAARIPATIISKIRKSGGNLGKIINLSDPRGMKIKSIGDNFAFERQ